MATYKSPLDMSKQLKDPYYGLDLDNSQKDELVSKFKGKDLDTALERLRGGEGYGDVINGLVRYENYDDPVYSYFRNKFNVTDEDLNNLRHYDYDRRDYKDNSKLTWRDDLSKWADPVKDFVEEHNVNIEDVQEFLNRAYDRTNRKPLRDGTIIYK